MCGLRRALEQEVYLLKGCRNFIVETDAKYLAEMLNNPGKMPNATINRWVDYIWTNFFFELVHKKGKTFGPDRLLRRRWYPEDPMPEDFTDGSEDGGGDIVVRQEGPQEDKPLKLETFYEDIDLREGYYNQIIESDTLMELGHAEPETQIEAIRSQTVYAEIVDPKDKEITIRDEEEPEEYDNDRRSEYARKQEEMLAQIKNYLTTRDKSQLGTMTADQAKLMRQVSHYWLDTKDGKLYRKSASGGNPQLVVGSENRIRLLKACHNEMGHRGTYATGRMLQQQFWWPEIEEDAIWYVKTCHLCQIRQRIVLETPPVVTHTPSIFQVLPADTVHITPPSNGCKYIVHGRCGLLSWMEAKAL